MSRAYYLQVFAASATSVTEGHCQAAYAKGAHRIHGEARLTYLSPVNVASLVGVSAQSLLNALHEPKRAPAGSGARRSNAVSGLEAEKTLLLAQA